MKRIFCLLLFFFVTIVTAQLWPGSGWAAAANLTAAMDTGGINDLSGLHLNPVNNRLYAVQGDGHLRVLQWNTTTNAFTQIASKTISGGPEGITQANLNANEFYTIDENNYEIRRYTHTANFGTVSLYKHWNLLSLPSPMQDTGNTGPEGIVFIPDGNLAAGGFISQQTGQPYTSQKGLGGLFFVAHQDEGFVWVFDVNPNANDDFAYVGKYRTNRSESCDLSFDRSTGLLYILHNTSPNNRIEVTDLSTAVTSGTERKFIIESEFAVPNPGDGNDNIEGFAMTPKCPQTGTPSAWLCRDVESNEADALLHDVLRWFNPFAAEGNCAPLSDEAFAADKVAVFPNPASSGISISGIQSASIRIVNPLGQTVMQQNVDAGSVIDIAALRKGIYMIGVSERNRTSVIKLIKN